MGFFDVFKNQSTKEKIEAKRTNSFGESVDKLDQDGNLPFGWVTHNRYYVDMIERDLQPFRQAILNAKTDLEMWAALKSFVLFLQDGKNRYYGINECVGKYFDEYICKSEEAKKRKKQYKEIEKKLKGQK